VVRYPSRIEIRDGAGALKTSIPVPVTALHLWGPGGASVLLRAARAPGVTGGFEEVRAIWPSESVMTLPDLVGPLGFAPDGRHYSGTVRTGRHAHRLAIYRCLQVVPRGEVPVAPPVGDIDLSDGRLIRPVLGPISAFMQGGHTGIDIGAGLGSPIVAADDGVVRAAGWVTNGGFRVCVTHAAGLETCYFHASGILVGVGQRVRRGEPVALIGMSGLAGGPHVHWEARFLGRLTDPLRR
jgi:murein DD-endopeptidase MepM/ murein hydrolase activator NlpD